MKTIRLTTLFILAGCIAHAQQTVQPLQPVRLSIFKNGTYFIKKESSVNVENGSFVIPAPTNVLMGAYWLGAGKGSILKSIIVKEDTFRVEGKAKSAGEYLKANINSLVTIKTGLGATEQQSLSGTLLEYNEVAETAKIRTADKKIVILKIGEGFSISLPESASSRFSYDSVAALAKVNVSLQQGSTLASTFSLQKGMQWYPSYFLRLENDKDAKLEMKATIVNGDEQYKNTDVDIIIGNPEMFYGKELDPVCVRYLNGQIFQFDNYQYNNAPVQSVSMLNTVSRVNYNGTGDNEQYPDDKQGAKLQDLYIYNLGKLDMESKAKLIVPVFAAAVEYEDIYTAGLDVNSSLKRDGIAGEVYHKFRIRNNQSAPFTTGPVLVINKDEMPVAQSQVSYTPVKGAAEITISKAIDVQVKNEETEIKRDLKFRKKDDSDYDGVTYNGKITLTNYQAKQIKLRLSKEISGTLTTPLQNGKSRSTGKEWDKINPITLLEWEVVLGPGEVKDIAYTYLKLD